MQPLDRDAIREKTGPKKCYKPSPDVVRDLNIFLRGWANYFQYGYPRVAFRKLSYFTRNRMTTHLNRRSQRKYHRPKGMTHYQYLQNWGFCAYDEMLTGEPDAGNLHVRFDEGE